MNIVRRDPNPGGRPASRPLARAHARAILTARCQVHAAPLFVGMAASAARSPRRRQRPTAATTSGSQPNSATRLSAPAATRVVGTRGTRHRSSSRRRCRPWRLTAQLPRRRFASAREGNRSLTGGDSGRVARCGARRNPRELGDLHVPRLREEAQSSAASPGRSSQGRRDRGAAARVSWPAGTS